jgi:PAS domain S-box-containing protein
VALALLIAASMLVHSEIDRRNWVERQLESAEQRYHQLFEWNPLAAWVYDRHSLAVLDVNATALSRYGYSRGEFLALKITDIRPCEEIPAVMESARHVTEHATTSGPWKHRTKSGALLDVEISSYPVVFDGKQARLVVALDVTERRQSENELLRRSAELETANRELEAFSYSVSHDLRAPLRAIDGFSQALLEDCAPHLDELGRNYLSRVRAATQGMGLLIDDLLNLSQVSRSEMRREQVDMSHVAQAVAGELRTSEPSRKVEFLISPALYAQGDARLARIVLENLFGNSWKFSSKREDAVIAFGARSEGESKTFFVRDNGVGFDQAHANRLFAPFQRLHGMNEFPGTGIGLAIVQRIVQRHGGKVWAKGAVNAGATVYFTL